MSEEFVDRWLAWIEAKVKEINEIAEVVYGNT